MKNLFLTISVLLPLTAFTQVVSVDTSVSYQKVFGFGASVKRNTQEFYTASPSVIGQIENLCFRDLYVTMLKTYCHPGIEPVNDNADPAQLNLAALDWSYLRRFYENNLCHATGKGSQQ